jgi:murein DD-endopeptidase MepM/ murein hydrolase activator NlpD
MFALGSRALSFLVIIGILLTPSFALSASSKKVTKQPSLFASLGLQLIGIATVADRPCALVTFGEGDKQKDVLLSEGDLLAGFTVGRVEVDQVVFNGEGGEQRLAMQKSHWLRADMHAKTYTQAYVGDNTFYATVNRYNDKTSVESVRLATRKVKEGRPTFIHPMRGRGWVSSPFGPRQAPRNKNRYGPRRGSFYHKGVDIAQPYGSTVYAAADGVVTASSWDYSRGAYIDIQHSKGYTTSYLHLSKRHVKKGQRIEAGQPIGAEGGSGISSGPHLHFEIRKSGVAVNPALYVRSLR